MWQSKILSKILSNRFAEESVKHCWQTYSKHVIDCSICTLVSKPIALLMTHKFCHRVKRVKFLLETYVKASIEIYRLLILSESPNEIFYCIRCQMFELLLQFYHYPGTKKLGWYIQFGPLNIK